MTESVEQQSGFSSLICPGKVAEICNCCGAKSLFWCGRETVAVYYLQFIFSRKKKSSQIVIFVLQVLYSTPLLVRFTVEKINRIHWKNRVSRRYCCWKTVQITKPKLNLPSKRWKKFRLNCIRKSKGHMCVCVYTHKYVFL